MWKIHLKISLHHNNTMTYKPMKAVCNMSNKNSNKRRVEKGWRETGEDQEGRGGLLCKHPLVTSLTNHPRANTAQPTADAVRL